MKEIIKLRDKFIEIADILDEVVELEKRDEAGEDVEKEIESLMGRYLFKCIELQELSKH